MPRTWELNEEEENWRRAILEAFRIEDALPELAPEVHGRFEPMVGVRAERVTYGTQFGMRVPGILYLPDPLPETRVPALIVVNGHGGDKYAWYAQYSGMLYASLGAAVLTYDPTGEGERNEERKSGTREHDVHEGLPEMARWMAGLMVTDLRQAVSYLASREEVDADRIAAAGYSLGSFVVAMAGAVDARLNACVLVGGGNLDGHDEYWDNSKPMCTGVPYQTLQHLGDRAPILYTLHARRGVTLVWNGLADTVVNVPEHGMAFFEDLRRRTIERAGGEEGVFEMGFTPDVSHRPHFVTRPVAEWLQEKLRFANWETVAKMGDTRIGTWAEQNGVEMDSFYASDDREGGTPGMGEGLPGIEREELHVFERDEWQREKGRLVHEAWREGVQAEDAGRVRGERQVPGSKFQVGIECPMSKTEDRLARERRNVTWSVDRGPWTVDRGPWTVDRKRNTVHPE